MWEYDKVLADLFVDMPLASGEKPPGKEICSAICVLNVTILYQILIKLYLNSLLMASIFHGGFAKRMHACIM